MGTMVTGRYPRCGAATRSGGRSRSTAAGAGASVRAMDLPPELAPVLAEFAGGASVDAVEALTLGITNRNFRVDVGGDSYVIRLSGRDTELLGIDREAEHVAASAAAAAG